MRIVRILICGLIFFAAARADDPPIVESLLPEGTVTIVFPATEFAVGDQKPFRVMVKPADGKDPPKAVRARFGMPYMHHWVTDEESQPYSDSGMEFMSDVPMNGVFRFRIWLDYADGHEAKTAIDFRIIPEQTLDPEVVEE